MFVVQVGHMGESLNTENMDFGFSDDMLDEIQKNIQSIIEGFDVPDDNKFDVIKKINFMYTRTKHLSLTDALTGLYNRRHFESNFEREFLRAKRYNSNLSIAVIDIDFFKKVNDTYGHACGDYVLKEVAFMINEAFRKTDMVFRYGGEEFVVILTETDCKSAIIPLERLRKSVECNNFKYSGNDLKVTISIGITSQINTCETPAQMFDLADKALYEAKNNGRNQYNVF